MNPDLDRFRKIKDNLTNYISRRRSSWRIDRPRLVTFFLLLAALTSLALGLTNLVRELEPWLLLYMTTLGLLAGWGVALTRFSGWTSGLFGLILGATVVFIRVGRLGKLLLTVAWALIDLGWSTLIWLQAGPPDLTSFFNALLTLWDHVGILLIRLSAWLSGLVMGQPAFDPAAIALVWGLAAWSVSIWAGWLIRRHNRPLGALMPAGALLAISLFLVAVKPWALLAFLGATLMLLATSRAVSRAQRWQRLGFEISTAGVAGRIDIEGERLLTATVLSLTLVALAGLAPAISVAQIVDLVTRLTDRPAATGRSVTSSLGLKRNTGRQTAIDRARVPGLPQQQLLGSGPELTDEIVMLIRLVQLNPANQDPQPEHEAETALAPPSGGEAGPARRLYWRSLSYERYTGRGWWTGTPKRVTYRAGQSIPLPFVFSGQRHLVQTIQAITKTGRLVYAAGALTRADQPYMAAWRSRSDLSGIEQADTINDLFGATIEAAQYQVESVLPVVSEAQLRAAGTGYPLWLKQRYLALPDDVPPRVLGLARDLTAAQLSPYDRVKALETYLRTFPYTLDLPPPPAGRDVVDYFLFDLQQGYCDYYASAMVVLARAAGIPARLVVGFLGGAYDPANDHYVVTAADAHSWVDIYFPGYGWVEFDPTARLAPIERATESEAAAALAEAEALSAGRSPEITPPDTSNRLKTGLGLSLLLLGGVLGAVIWIRLDAWRLRRLPPPAALAVIYQRLLRYGHRLAVPVQVGDTPYQFSRAFRQRLAGLEQLDVNTGPANPSPSAQLPQHITTRPVYQPDSYLRHDIRLINKRRRALLAAVHADLSWLIDFFVFVYYSPHLPSDADQARAIRTWGRLRRRLWVVWLLRD